MLRYSHIRRPCSKDRNGNKKVFKRVIYEATSIRWSQVNTINHPQIKFDAPPVYWVVKSTDLASNSPLVHLATIKDWCVCVVQCANWERVWSLSIVPFPIAMMFSATWVYHGDRLPTELTWNHRHLQRLGLWDWEHNTQNKTLQLRRTFIVFMYKESINILTNLTNGPGGNLCH